MNTKTIYAMFIIGAVLIIVGTLIKLMTSYRGDIFLGTGLALETIAFVIFLYKVITMKNNKL